MRSLFVACVFALSTAVVACSGDDGAPGAAGTQGAAGAPGAKGDKGDKGDPGATGLAGKDGENGAAGEAGAAGVVAVRSFDASSIATSLAAATPIVPDKCRTAAYTAGAGEHAIVSLDASVLPNMAQAGVVYASAGAFIDGGAVTSIGTQSFEGLGDGIASSGVSVDYPLVAGKSYVFGAVLESASAISVTKSSCHGTVLIVRE